MTVSINPNPVQLSEPVYLRFHRYLLFDPDNFLNNNGNSGTVVKQTYGECLLDTGGYIFNTEAHPIDPDALKCCYERSREQLMPINFVPDDYLGETMQLQQRIYNDVRKPAQVDDGRLTTDNIVIVTDESGQAVVQVETVSQQETVVEVEVNDATTREKLGNTSNGNDVDVVTEINQIVSDKFTNISQVLESGLDAVGEWLKSENARSELMKIIGKLDEAREQNSADNKASIEQVNANDESATTNANTSGSNDGVQQPTEPKIDWIAAVRPEEIFQEVASHESEQQQPGQFDVQRLIEKVRRMSNGTRIIRDYESLSCRSQTYLQRLAIHGEILT